MDFSLPREIEGFRAAVTAFVRDRVLPVEADRANWDEHENIREDVRDRLRAEVRARGLWAPQVPKALGGQGLPMIGLAACYEAMNESIFGPACFNCAAPDDGNMQLLAKVATPAQQERFLAPVVAGRARSAFAMTEPHPGSGSDPAMTLTTAQRRGDRWVVHGRKWFITGAEGAQTFVLVAKTSEDPRKGLTAFLHHRDDPGWRIARRIPIMGPEEHGGHCELVYEGLEIPDENRLMNVGDGLKVTQIRLGAARLTHCMRWLGLAKRSLAIALDYTDTRMASVGRRLADLDSVRGLLGEAAMQIEIGRLLTMRAARKLDMGDFARKEVSMAKVVVADALHKAVDTAIQLNGARGYSQDTVLEWIYRYARQARLVDGASEVHKAVLARFLREERDGFWRWDE
ncbi:MAG: acyl-CoA dehydrogenase family protein [Betaproteobacteria bacterium]|nr:acyl-CoA dehydrogenase family protein [Betaproteobacteria bacterium]MDH5286540.1 acyl-CoA dehydrogenase family protein [Betaproteobacteria bacterium]